VCLEWVFDKRNRMWQIKNAKDKKKGEGSIETVLSKRSIAIDRDFLNVHVYHPSTLLLIWGSL
jgi:hypothetical protein